ncbi:MAG: DsbA family protein [Alphaproteobacteria bacterium]|nr:DsbA family protein [Alphaproteobacteria bacterium]MBP9876903.1 DsbA family protein [Alphaproteobacteria bacterium]
MTLSRLFSVIAFVGLCTFSTQSFACNGTIIDDAQQALLKKDLRQWPSETFGKGTPTLIIFYDYLCGYCKRSDIELENYLKKGDRSLKIVYRPLGKLGPVSQNISRSVLSAARQDKFNEFHNELVHYNDTPDDTFLMKTAEKLNLDIDKFEKDKQHPAITKMLDENNQLAKKLGIKTVPSFYLESCNIPHSMTEEGFEKEIGDAVSNTKAK